MNKFKNLNLKFKENNNSNFFITINNIVFRSFIGIFLFCFILLLMLALVYNTYIYVNFAFYTGLGLVVYLIGHLISFIIQKKLAIGDSVESDKKQKNFFIRSIFLTSIFYLLLAWFFMILIGSFNGFNLYFASNSDVLAFTDNLFATKTVGFILFYLTVSLTFVVLTVHIIFVRFKRKANFTFNIRRKMVEKVRSTAQKSL